MITAKNGGFLDRVQEHYSFEYDLVFRLLLQTDFKNHSSVSLKDANKIFYAKNASIDDYIPLHDTFNKEYGEYLQNGSLDEEEVCRLAGILEHKYNSLIEHESYMAN